MAGRKNDLEYEMSKFEEEITRFTPNVPKQSQPASHAIKIKPIINQTIFQQPTYPTITPSASQQTFLPPQMNKPLNMPTTSTSASTHNPPLKRDASHFGSDEQKPKKPKDNKSLNNSSNNASNKDKKSKKFIRLAGGQKWEDETLNEWDTDDFRLFCGDLGNEVTDELLTRAFSKYTSFQKAKVVRDKRTQKSKGYGFVSFKDSADFIKAMREMNGKYVGNRPIKLKKSNWRERNIEIVKKKEVEKAKMGLK